MRHLILLLATAIVAISPAVAEKRPEPGPGDPRIQAVAYDAEDVVLIEAAPGYQVTIRFSPDERIENVAVGDSTAWQVTPNRRGDHLFVKPLQQGTRTDMTVVTDARIYAFTLTAIFQPLENTPITVSFRYPAAAPVPPPLAATAVAAAAADWRYRGDRQLRPDTITDDGVHITIAWPAGVTIPAVFAVDAQGREALVNGMTRDGRFVVDAIVPRLVFRLDRQVGRAQRIPLRKAR